VDPIVTIRQRGGTNPNKLCNRSRCSLHRKISQHELNTVEYSILVPDFLLHELSSKHLHLTSIVESSIGHVAACTRCITSQSTFGYSTPTLEVLNYQSIFTAPRECRSIVQLIIQLRTECITLFNSNTDSPVMIFRPAAVYEFKSAKNVSGLFLCH
jgi:hypothetical protein